MGQESTFQYMIFPRIYKNDSLVFVNDHKKVQIIDIFLIKRK